MDEELLKRITAIHDLCHEIVDLYCKPVPVVPVERPVLETKVWVCPLCHRQGVPLHYRRVYDQWPMLQCPACRSTIPEVLTNA